MKNFKGFSKIFPFLIFMLLSRFEIAKAYDDLITVSSTPNFPIPDNCARSAEVEMYTSMPQEEAVVLLVDVSFTVSHPYPGDLIVILQYDDDTSLVEILWNMNGQGSTYTKNGIWAFYGLKSNTQWKLILRDCDAGFSGILVSWTLTIHYHVPPDPPALVWASTGSGPREIDLGWFQVFDPQCGQYWIEWNRDPDTLRDYNVTEGGIYVRSCDSTSKTLDKLRCVEEYFFRIKSVSTYGAYIMGKPSALSAGALSSYCQDVYVSGKLKYVNYDDQYADYSSYPDTVPLEKVLVTIWGISGDSFAVPLIYTNSSGDFITTSLALVSEPIYIKFHLIDQDNHIGVFNYYNDSLIYTFSDTLGPDSSFNVIKDERSGRPDTIFAKASYSFDYLGRTKYFFQALPPSPWDTPPVQVLYDYNNTYSLAESGFDTLTQLSQIYLTSRGRPNFMYRLTTPIHECAHNIHRKAWNINNLHRPECPSIHYPDSPTTDYCALVEGWAEFLSCVPYTISSERKAWYLKHNDRDLEDNDWWAGPDGKNVDGSIVEGAVASAWYDMEDLNIDNPDECNNVEYYELTYECSKIFDIFKTYKPQNIIEFMNYWQNDDSLEDWEKEHLIKIFAQHHIVMPVSGDVNSDGKVSLADIVYLINYLFKLGPGFESVWKGDTNGDCKVSVGDVVYLINYLFRSGPAPVCNGSCWSCS